MEGKSGFNSELGVKVIRAKRSLLRALIDTFINWRHRKL